MEKIPQKKYVQKIPQKYTCNKDRKYVRAKRPTVLEDLY